MADGTLYTYRGNFRTSKILVAAQFSGAKVKVLSDAPEFIIGKTNRSEPFTSKFPLGKLPVFEGQDGTLLFKSNAIAYYVGTDELRGTTVLDSVLVQQWLEFTDNDILPAYCTWLFPVLGITAFNKQNTEKAKEDIRAALNVLNTHLSTRTFLVGERISLADISVACSLVELYRHVLDEEFRKPYQHTNRWFLTLVNQPQFLAALGNVSLTHKMAQFDAEKFAELHQSKISVGGVVQHGDIQSVKHPEKHTDKQPDKHTDKQPDKHTVKQPDKHTDKQPDKHTDKQPDKHTDKQPEKGGRHKKDKKAEKKDKAEKKPDVHKEEIKSAAATATAATAATTTATATVAVNDLEGDEEFAEVSFKDVFAHLPKGTFNMDDFKKVYSNNDTKLVALPYFFTNFDKDNYSIWYSEYKYPKDLKVVFMSSNLITGMFQRLDGMRKHAFGSVIVFGQDNKSTISGVWIWRGQELAFSLSSDLQIDHESYTWKKLDPDSQDTKTKVTEYFSWEGKFGGKKFNQGKIFK